MNYSNNVNKEHKGIKTLKKDTPKEEIEKKLKENFEMNFCYKKINKININLFFIFFLLYHSLFFLFKYIIQNF